MLLYSFEVEYLHTASFAVETYDVRVFWCKITLMPIILGIAKQNVLWKWTSVFLSVGLPLPMHAYATAHFQMQFEEC